MVRGLLLTVLLTVAGVVHGSEPELLLSRQLMEAWGIVPNQLVQLSADPSGTEPTTFRVVAAYEPLPDPFRLTARRWEARMHLGDLQQLVGDDSVGRINVKVDDPATARDFRRRLRTRLPLLEVRGTGPGNPESTPFAVLERFHQAIALVTVLGSTAFLLSLMIMRSEERRETAGILRLIGFSRPRILVEVFVESILIAAVGAAIGLVLAVVIEDFVNGFFQWYYDTALVFVHVTPSIMWRCLAVALPLGLLAGVTASWALIRRDIMRLLRR